MGVNKLWDLLTATALPARVESLFGRVCCIDASFWISHCLASQSNLRQGGDVIAVFFLRICYLLDKGIKPVFVFDGKSPFAKIKTILKRRLISQKISTNHKLLAFNLLATQIKNSAKYKRTSAVATLSEPTNVVLPIEDVEQVNPPENPQAAGPVDLLELFPEEFLTKGDEEFDRELQMLKDCDFLSNKSKYDLINSLKDNIIQNDRQKSLKMKGNIAEYSNHQINSYMRDVKINKEIESLKAQINRAYMPLQARTQHMSFRNDLASEICDYNEYFSHKYENYFNKYTVEPMADVPQPYANEAPCEPPAPELVDESVFATDEQIFGDEFLAGIKVEDESEKKRLKPEIDQDEKLVLRNKAQNLIDSEGALKPTSPNNLKDSSNDYFLRLYREHLLRSQGAEHDTNITSDLSEVASEEDDSPSSESEDEFTDGMPKSIGCTPTGVIYETRHTQGIKMPEKHPYYEDIQALLDLFGVPYLVAPSEAESQCARMNEKGDCYAVISDDSDALVFGAKRLLKNFYNDNVFELYTSERIRRELGIGRKQLALIAVIVGCDYTSGVRGIGIVNALEVIKAYPNFDDLYDFKHWATGDVSVESALSDDCPLRSAYKQAHINYRVHWTFGLDFPNREAYNLFLKPNTTDEYTLAWAKPKPDPIIDLMSKRSTLPLDQARECLNMLFAKKSQQFIMEDVVPEIRSRSVPNSAVKNYRKSLKTNLSAFRRVLTELSSRSRFNINTNLVIERNHTLSKIRSKRMVESIRTIRKRQLAASANRN